MFMTIVAILLILWALGFIAAFTMGGLIHILLVLAVVIVLWRIIHGRRAV